MKKGQRGNEGRWRDEGGRNERQRRDEGRWRGEGGMDEGQWRNEGGAVRDREKATHHKFLLTRDETVGKEVEVRHQVIGTK